MEIQNLLDLFLTFGLPGIILALVVLIAVFLAKRAKLVITGDQARAANIILAVILSGLNPLNPDIEPAIIATIGSLLSALVFELSKKYLPKG